MGNQMTLRSRRSVGLCGARLDATAANASKMHIQHIQSEVAAVIVSIGNHRRGLFAELVQRGINTGFKLRQCHGTEIRDENDVSEDLYAGNRNRANLLYERAVNGATSVS